MVLYHRAATVCPHDSTHSVAARRTAAMISTWNDTARNTARLSARVKNDAISRVSSCPESTALGARDLTKFPDLSIIPDILRYVST